MMAARQMGAALAQRGLTLVYGGGRTGLMGQLAEATLRAGGQVIGVIPQEMVSADVALTELADLRVVRSMHERKSTMAELADGFVAMPGGLGTLEEFFEALTWAQLSLHDKPCGLLNVGGYYDRLIDFLDLAVEQGFVHALHREMVLVAEDAEALLRQFEDYAPARLKKTDWILRLAGEGAG
jgi:uncharacterized protein (TIGR00730 family)